MAQHKGCIPANKQNIKMICKTCENSFTTCLSKMKNRANVFCSKQCYWKDLRSRSGPNTSNWKGGKCSQNYLDRRRFQREVKEQVLERDNYICQLCNKNGDKLTVDHIRSWSEYPDLRFDINNCRTLCVKCHYETTFQKKMKDSIKIWGFNYV